MWVSSQPVRPSVREGMTFLCEDAGTIKEWFSSTKSSIKIPDPIVKACKLLGFHNETNALSIEQGGKTKIVFDGKFVLVSRLLAGSQSFQEIERTVSIVKEYVDARSIWLFRGINRKVVSKINQHIGILALTKLAAVVENAKGFSLAIDGTTLTHRKHYGIRIRTYAANRIRSFYVGHLMLAPRPEGTTPTQHLYVSVVELLDLLFPRWQ
jgi:hypothetical protein